MSKSALVVVIALTLAGCATDAGSDKLLVVSAAASLTDAFLEMETEFEAANPGIDVVMNFGGSSTLREQILEGAPVDVFASADQANMDAVAKAGELLDDPAVFATNSMVIVVPSGNPAGVTGLADLARNDLLIGLCARGVPCGELAREVLRLARVEPAPDTEEPDVRALLTKILLGELDVGIVYHSDVVASGDTVDGIVIPDQFNVTAVYPIGVVAGSGQPDSAERFVDFVLSATGRSILNKHGFTSP